MPDASSSLIDAARAGKARFYLQFGGQGAPWFSELQRLVACEELSTYFDHAFGAIEEEIGQVGSSVALAEGLDPRRWLAKPDKAPDEGYLSSAVVSLTMIQVVQLGHFERLIQRGIGRDELLHYTSGVTGHSQGMITSSLVAQGIAEETLYYARLRQIIKYILFLGVRLHEVYPYPTARSELRRDFDEPQPAPMAAVIGPGHAAIEEMVERANRTLPPDRAIYIGLYNSDDNRILCSTRPSLLQFAEEFGRELDAAGYKWIPLLTTCPFHTPHLTPVQSRFEADIDRIGYRLASNDLKVPIYSFFDGRNLQGDSNISRSLYVDMSINRLDWQSAVEPALRDQSITHILDFGPAKVSQRFTLEALKKGGRELPVVPLAIPREFERHFPKS